MTTPARILLIDHTAQLGGGEIALLNLVVALDRTRFEPVVLLFADGPLRSKLATARIETHLLLLATEVGEARKDQLGGSSLLRVRSVVHTIGFVWRLSRFIRRIKPAVVQTNSLKADIIGGAAGRLARVPVIWHVRDRIMNDYLPGRVVTTFRWLARWLPSRIVANSQATLSALMEGRGQSACEGGHSQRCRVIHDGVPALPSKPTAEPQPAVAGPHRPVRVGLVGRLAPWKGQHVFIQAARLTRQQFPDVRFQIIGAALFGEEKYERELHAMVARNGLNDVVEFTGFRPDMVEVMAELDILVHASITGEPFGQVLIEAMTAGKPVVATRGGGVPEIVIDGETGLLVPMGDPEAMAKAVLRLLGDASLRAAMGERGQQRVADHFTIQHTASQFQRLYDELLH